MRLSTGVAGMAQRMGVAWQRRLPWYPGDWIWPALVGLVVAAAGVAFAILYSHHGRSSSAPIVATTRVQSVVTTAPLVTDTGAAPPPAPTITVDTTQTNLTPPGSSSTPTPTTPAQRGLFPWPAGRNGYTVVLESLPAAGNGRAAALHKARQALSAGLPEVGVLDSGQYSSLHPGYLVVFSGIYGSLAKAQSAASAAHAKGFGSAYARQITT